MRSLVLGCLTALTLSACAGRAAPADTPASRRREGAALRDELLTMLEADQAIRRELMQGDFDEPPPELLERGRAVDADNLARLRAIVREHGWPGRSLVGDEAALAALALIIHADSDLAFQRECLALIEQAMTRDDVDRAEVAALIDRVRLASDEPQLYGTQAELEGGVLVPLPIEDPTHVDERRAAMGMPPLAQALAEQEAALEAFLRAQPGDGA